MPIDRWGRYVQIGYSETECEWIRAANTLQGSERVSAFQDIADMSGRTYVQIREKAAVMRRLDNELKAKVLAHSYEWRLSGPVLTARSHLGRKPGGDMSSIKPPSMASLMAGK